LFTLASEQNTGFSKHPCSNRSWENHLFITRFWNGANRFPTDNALAVASKNLNTDHRPDFTNTEPAANIGPFPQWSDPKKIVAMDPLGKKF
jgi:hypothetical protein